MENNKDLYLPHVMHKTQFKMDCRSKCKSKNQNFQKKIEGNLCDLSVGDYSLDLPQKAQTKREKLINRTSSN